LTVGFGGGQISDGDLGRNSAVASARGNSNGEAA
jgi:hypothetical protein